MDGFGYKNWSDTSYDSSPPTYGSDDPYGFQGDSRRHSMKSSLSSTNMRSSGGDEYNFEINGDDDDDSPDYRSKPKSTRFTAASVPSNTRRMSQEERMKDILDRNRRESVASLAKTDPPPETYISMIKSSWDEAIGGGDGSERNSDASLYETLNKVTANADARGNSIRRESNANLGYGSYNNNGGAVSPLSDREEDSFNISAADFEVGTIAARKSQEKAAPTRNRRQSLNSLPTSPTPTSSFSRNANNPLSISTRSPMGSAGRDGPGINKPQQGGKRYERVRDSKNTSGMMSTDGSDYNNDVSLYASTNDDSYGAMARGGNELAPPSLASAYSNYSYDSYGDGGDNDSTNCVSEGVAGNNNQYDRNDPNDSDNQVGGDDDDDYSLDDYERDTSKQNEVDDPIRPKTSASNPEASSLSKKTAGGGVAESTTSVVTDAAAERRRSVAEIMNRWKNPSTLLESTGRSATATPVAEGNESKSNSAANSATNSRKSSPHTVQTETLIDANDKDAGGIASRRSISGDDARGPSPAVLLPPQYPAQSDETQQNAPISRSGTLSSVFNTLSAGNSVANSATNSRGPSPGVPESHRPFGSTEANPGIGGVGNSMNSFTSNSDIVNMTANTEGNGSGVTNYDDETFEEDTSKLADRLVAVNGDEVNTSVAPPPPPITSEAVYEMSHDTNDRPVVPASMTTVDNSEENTPIVPQLEPYIPRVHSFSRNDQRTAPVEISEPPGVDNSIDMTSGTEYIQQITQLTSAMDAETRDRRVPAVAKNNYSPGLKEGSPFRNTEARSARYAANNHEKPYQDIRPPERDEQHYPHHNRGHHSMSVPVSSHEPYYPSHPNQPDFKFRVDPYPYSTSEQYPPPSMGISSEFVDGGSVLEYSRKDDDGRAGRVNIIGPSSIPLVSSSAQDLEAYIAVLEASQRAYHEASGNNKPKTTKPKPTATRSSSSVPRTRASSSGIVRGSMSNQSTPSRTATTRNNRTSQNTRVNTDIVHIHGKTVPSSGSGIDVNDVLHQQIQVTESLTKQFQNLSTEMKQFRESQKQQEQLAALQKQQKELIKSTDSIKGELGVKSKLADSLKKKTAVGTSRNGTDTKHVRSVWKKPTDQQKNGNDVDISCVQLHLPEAFSAPSLEMEQQVISSFKGIIEKSVALGEKENKLKMWEEALAVRESMIEVQQAESAKPVNAVGLRAERTERAGSPPPPPPPPIAEASSQHTPMENYMLKSEHATILMDKLQEIEELKSELYEWRNGLKIFVSPHAFPTEDREAKLEKDENIDIENDAGTKQDSSNEDTQSKANDKPVGHGEERVVEVRTTNNNGLEAKLKQFLSSAIVPEDPVTTNQSQLPKYGMKRTVPDPVCMISKKEMNDLIFEASSLERLIAGYQRENEKLLTNMKEHEAASAVIKAQFYDQQEEMNRMCNQLKNEKGLSNMVSTSGVNIRKSAEVLRMELDREGELREKIIEVQAEALAREKELQLTINKLRTDNKQLAAQVGNIPVDLVSSEAAIARAVEAERAIFNSELDKLQKKLHWYAENQELLDKTASECGELKILVNICKREIKKAGTVEWKCIRQELEQLRTEPGEGLNESILGGEEGEKEAESEMESSSAVLPVHKKSSKPGNVMSTTPSKTGKSTPSKGAVGGRSSGIVPMKRSPADIKRIKELEEALKDLQETIRKRHPDSIPALIHAAQLTDSAVNEKKEMEQLIADLRTEIKHGKEEHALKMRSMRQELERLKLSTQEALKRNANASAGDTNETTSKSTSSSKSVISAIKTLPQALGKLKELEKELERTRTFYKKKVDDMGKKHALQMRALKRGSVVPAEEVGEAAAGDESEVDENQEGHSGGEVVVDADAAADSGLGRTDGTANTDESLKRKLDDATNELETSKSKIVALNETIELLKKANEGYTKNNDIDMKIRLQDAVGQVDRLENKLAMIEEQHRMKLEFHKSEFESYKQLHSASINDSNATKLHYQTLLEHKEQEVSQWKDKVRSEELNVLNLKAELNNLQNKLSMQISEVEHMKSQPLTPSLAQYSMLESHINDLENRLKKREKELLTQLENNKMNSKIERARLLSQHEQEMLEKDEQFLRFQNEMEHIIQMLRQQTLHNNLNLSASNIGDVMGVVEPAIV